MEASSDGDHSASTDVKVETLSKESDASTTDRGLDHQQESPELRVLRAETDPLADAAKQRSRQGVQVQTKFTFLHFTDSEGHGGIGPIRPRAFSDRDVGMLGISPQLGVAKAPKLPSTLPSLDKVADESMLPPPACSSPDDDVELLAPLIQDRSKLIIDGMDWRVSADAVAEDGQAAGGGALTPPPRHRGDSGAMPMTPSPLLQSAPPPTRDNTLCLDAALSLPPAAVSTDENFSGWTDPMMYNADYSGGAVDGPIRLGALVDDWGQAGFGVDGTYWDGIDPTACGIEGVGWSFDPSLSMPALDPCLWDAGYPLGDPLLSGPGMENWIQPNAVSAESWQPQAQGGGRLRVQVHVGGKKAAENKKALQETPAEAASTEEPYGKGKGGKKGGLATKQKVREAAAAAREADAAAAAAAAAAAKANTDVSLPTPAGQVWDATDENRSCKSVTTVMLRNIPNKYTRDMLVNQLHEGGRYRIDFVYLPIDFKNKCNVGYCFLNFCTPKECQRFMESFNNVEVRQCLPGFNSRKIAEVTPARVQGLEENVRRLRNSPVMTELRYRPEWMPIMLDKHGRNVTFPEPEQGTPAAKPRRRQRDERR
eukprot:TRINITY_DN2429_c0_g6_i1.p1 TRINITY_DN2429_c0_g6~~TRINITY_DN2429_c0_g6_i1.p1  ORF type:complete len:596 (+),score=150.82 TRINITY_DN2429_c0_g6_i1:113-1900(+)